MNPMVLSNENAGDIFVSQEVRFLRHRYLKGGQEVLLDRYCLNFSFAGECGLLIMKMADPAESGHYRRKKKNT